MEENRVQKEVESEKEENVVMAQGEREGAEEAVFNKKEAEGDVAPLPSTERQGAVTRGDGQLAEEPEQHIDIAGALMVGVEDEEEGEEGQDPRAELVRQLLEYQAFKEAALSLEARPLLDRDVFSRGAPAEDPAAVEEEEEATIEVGIFELVQAFRAIIAGLGKSDDLVIDTERMSLTDRINEIMELLSEKKQLTFTELLGERTDRKGIVYTFLAILELMKLRMIKAYQSGPFGTIRLFLAVEG